MIVLHILDHSLPILSGYSVRSRNIVHCQRALGLRPVALTSSRHASIGVGPDLVGGIPHYRTRGSGEVRRSYIGEIQAMARLARRIAQVATLEGAELLHAHSPALNGLPALWAGRRLGLPVVYETRAFWEDAAVDHGVTREGTLRYRLSRALETIVFRHADRVVTIAHAMRKEIAGRGVDARKIAVVPNGVDVERFQPRHRNPQLARRLGLERHRVFGFVGSFYRYEGLRFLLEALPALRTLVPDCRLLLVGGGEEEAALRELAAPFGDAVIFAGSVPHDDVLEFYPLIDVFVCPRRRMRLTELVTPLKPLEAMAMARPLLASDVGGLAELISHGITGLLFRAENRDALVSEAFRLASDADLRNRLGTAGREHVERERAWSHVVRQYADLYREIDARQVDRRPVPVRRP